MDLYLDSTSDSELDGCGNPDYDEDLDTASGDIGVASHCDYEQATSSSKARVHFKRTATARKRINSGKACLPATESIQYRSAKS